MERNSTCCMDESKPASEYPECDKALALRPFTETLGDFLDVWCQEKGYEICYQRKEDGNKYFPIHRPVNAIIAEYFGIDQRKLEAEKKNMLAKLQKETVWTP